MDWTSLAEINQPSVLSDYINSIDPSTKELYDMLANVSEKTRNEILEDSSMHYDKILASAYYLGYFNRPPNIPNMDSYGIEVLPEIKARKLVPRTIYDAIACYRRGFIDLIETMDNPVEIFYGSNENDDKYIMELLTLRPEWVSTITIQGKNYKDILLKYPSLLNIDMSHDITSILSGSEFIRVIGGSRDIWIMDILGKYEDVNVYRYIIDNKLPISPESMLENASDETVLKFIELDNELEFITSYERTNLYLNTGRDIFLKFVDRNQDEVDVKYTRTILLRSKGLKLNLIFDDVEDIELSDSDIRLIYTLGHRVEVRQYSKLSIIVRLLDYIPIDRFVGEEHTSTNPDGILIELYIKYPLGVRRLWEQYSIYNTLYLDIMAYYLPIKVSSNFKPSVTQLPIYNYLTANRKEPKKYKGDLNIV